MKNKTLYLKVINLLLIALILTAYQGIVTAREKNETITQLELDLEAAQHTITQAKQTLNSGGEQQEREAAVQYKDGTYTGQADGFGGIVEVTLVIEDSTITIIEITEASKEDKSYVELAKGVIDEILIKQTYEVDAISGATYTSTGIKNAVKSALERAKEE